VSRSPATDQAWFEVFDILGKSNVDLPTAIQKIAQLVLLERAEIRIPQERKEAGEDRVLLDIYREVKACMKSTGPFKIDPSGTMTQLLTTFEKMVGSAERLQ